MSEFDDLLDSGAKKKPRKRRKASVGELAVTGSAETMSGDPVRSSSDKKERPRPHSRPAGRSSEVERSTDHRHQGRSTSQCSRWMHHRKGEYCKACGKVP